MALKADLGHNSFIVNMQAHSLTKTQIQDLIAGVNGWMKPEGVPNPMGNRRKMQVQGGPRVQSSMSLSEWPQ